MENTHLYQKNIPCYGSYDVVVLGGGPAGVCAAIEAARAGQRVLLCEASGMLGGMATVGLVGPLMTTYDRDARSPTVGGLYREIVTRLVARGAAIPPEDADAPSIYTSYIERYHKHVTPFNSFMLQVVLDEMTAEAGVEVLLYTRFADAIVENGQITAAVLAALEGLITVCGKVFLDCTGNADVAAAAGVPTYKGEEESGVPQPGTLMFEVGGVVDSGFVGRPERPVKAYKTPDEGVYKVNHYRVFGVDAANSKSMSAAHREARGQVLEAFSVLRRTQGFEQATLLQVGSVLGVRESRHIKGKYQIKVADVANGTKFEDRIAVYGFGMDVHPRNSEQTGNFKIQIANRYYVPYRSLLPNGCDNLLVAGKTISCESQAAGGLRCMPCAMAMGQAAGAAAALANEGGVPIAAVDVPTLQQTLQAHGAILD